MNILKKALVPGLVNTSGTNPVQAKMKVTLFLRTLAGQVSELRKDGVQGPYTVVLPDKAWEAPVSDSTEYPFQSLVKEITEGALITHQTNPDIFLVSEQGVDFELHLGQDISQGYDDHDSKKVNLFFTESFIYQIHSPEAVRVLQPRYN